MKLAIVLFSLGGPDSPEAVRPFLFNLFNDKAIIGAPQPVRWLLARLISGRRAPVAREIYEHIGGASPLLENTVAQGKALEAALSGTLGGVDVKSFVAMRYWHPMAPETAARVREWTPDRILLLPMYPQFSTTTSGSSVADWRRAARAAGLETPTRTICCYPTERGLIGAMAEDISHALGDAGGPDRARILYSAHGLPEKIVKAGDPYQWQVEQTARAVDMALDATLGTSANRGHDSIVCYQSRVGPLAWIGPSTEDEIRRAAADGKAIVLAPIAFVSEHSETLVELDIEYRRLAEGLGVETYIRTPTVSTAPAFIDGLAGLVKASLDGEGIGPADGARLCPGAWRGCPCTEG